MCPTCPAASPLAERARRRSSRFAKRFRVIFRRCGNLGNRSRRRDRNRKSSRRDRAAARQTIPDPRLSVHFDFFPPLRPPLRLADLPALEILAARVLDIPLRLRASYLSLFL